MINKIKAKTDKEVFLFPNWVDTSLFFPLPSRHLLKTKWGFQITDTVCLYSGAIGEKQGLESILNAAELLVDIPGIKFVIGGSGPYKEKLIQLAASKKLSNVQFLPVQDKGVFNEFLNMADLHLILQKATASDLVMPSKLTTILAVGGVSVVTSPQNTSLFDLINKYDVGFAIEPENDELLADTISNAANNVNIQKKAENARLYALKYLNIDNVMLEFVNNTLN